MNHMLPGFLVLLFGVSSVVAFDEPPSTPATVAEQNLAIAKEFNSEGYALRQAKTDEERKKIADRVKNLALRSLELAEKHPQDPGAIDALSPGTPVYYVIDPVGVIRYKWVGSPGEKAIDAALEKLIQNAEHDAKKSK